MNQHLKMTFYAALSLATVTIVGYCIVFIGCFGNNAYRVMEYMAYGGLIGLTSYHALMICLLINLFLRIDVVFGESAIAMSKNKKRIFIALIVLNVIVYCVMMVFFWRDGYIFHVVEDIITIGAFWIIYTINSVIFVRQFFANLVAMSGYNVTTRQNVLDLKMNNSQQKMVKLSAKYLALFAVATLTSFIAFVLIMILVFPAENGVPVVEPDFFIRIQWFAWVIDVFVNVSCLLLQYGHMDAVYLKYCGRPDACCRVVATAKMKGKIRKVVTERDSISPKRVPALGDDNEQVCLNSQDESVCV